MKKRLLSMFLVTAMAVTLAACGGGAGGNTSSNSAGGDAVATDDAAGGSEETDIMVDKAKIEVAADGLGDWEDEYTADMDVAGDESFTWGYIDMGFKDTFTTKIRNTFKYYCELNFPNVEILEGDGQMDANIQIQLAENFIAQGVDGIILDPTDADACVGVVDTCLENDVPLVAVNAVIHSDEVAVEKGASGKYGFVGSSNYESGQIQGQWIIDNIPDDETVQMCYQRGEEGFDHTQQRQDGVFDTLDAAGYNYNLNSFLISKYMRDIAMTNAEDWISKFGEEITVIPCCNDESAMGTLNAYTAAGLADGVKILGIDANQDCLQEVKKGTVAMTVFQNALGQAKWAACSMYNANLNGEKSTKQVIVPFELVDATNVDDYLD